MLCLGGSLGGLVIASWVCVSRSVGSLVLSVRNKHYGRLRYSCVMVGDVIYGKSGQVLKCGR